MTTQLFWQCCGMVNKFYKITLRYPFCIVMDPKQELFVVNQASVVKSTMSTFVIVMFLVIVLAIDVFYGIWITKEIHLSLQDVICNIFFILISGLCQILLVITVPNLRVFGEQYFNCLFRFERQALARSIFFHETTSIKTALEDGKSIKNILLRIMF